MASSAASTATALVTPVHLGGGGEAHRAPARVVPRHHDSHHVGQLGRDALQFGPVVVVELEPDARDRPVLRAELGGVAAPGELAQAIVASPRRRG